MRCVPPVAAWVESVPQRPGLGGNAMRCCETRRTLFPLLQALDTRRIKYSDSECDVVIIDKVCGTIMDEVKAVRKDFPMTDQTLVKKLKKVFVLSLIHI